ncbi:hypothetical protein FA13DRAFT_125919 [Coprinellus micaceus]|uniref:Uncharacterized protein n=1 Tax=Coprinellus micaceus TaxID=71717 RepID=A0A4Y7TJ67_COPMI|nr:hypothetical protein FA13DRAFT_125919 [Coprinellus micaceus]
MTLAIVVDDNVPLQTNTLVALSRRYLPKCARQKVVFRRLGTHPDGKTKNLSEREIAPVDLNHASYSEISARAGRPISLFHELIQLWSGHEVSLLPTRYEKKASNVRTYPLIHRR